MEVIELVQHNFQIKVLTRHGVKGCQAAAILIAYGNSDTTAGSRTDLFPLEKSCALRSLPYPPTPAPDQPAGVLWQVAWRAATHPWSLRVWEIDLFTERYASHVARHCSKSVLAKACCIFGRERSSLFGAGMTNLLMGRHDKQLTNQTPMEVNV